MLILAVFGLINEDIDAIVDGIKSGIQSRSLFLAVSSCSLFLAHSALEHGNKPVNIMQNLLENIIANRNGSLFDSSGKLLKGDPCTFIFRWLVT